MQSRQALVVAALDGRDPYQSSLLEAAVAGLEARRTVDVLDLVAAGFVSRMSAAEHAAYHSGDPIIDEMVAAHVRLVGQAGALVFVFPTRWWQPPALLKAWLERVLVPGVGFVFDEKGRVRPHLTGVEAIAGVTIYDMDARSVRRVVDGGRRMLLRALRANAPRRVRTEWCGLYEAAAAPPVRKAQFLGDVQERLAKL